METIAYITRDRELGGKLWMHFTQPTKDLESGFWTTEDEEEGMHSAMLPDSYEEIYGYLTWEDDPAEVVITPMAALI